MALIDTRPTVRPRVRRAAVIACVILAPIASWTLWDYVEARRLAQIVAVVQASGAPITPPQKRPDGVSAPDNAARYYDAAAALLDTSGLYAPGGLGVRLDAGVVPPRSLLAETQAFLARNAEAEQFLSRATALDFRGYPAVNAYDRFSGLTALSYFADLRTFERVISHDGDGAVDGLLAQLRLIRAYRANSVGTPRDELDFFSTFVLARASAEVSQVVPLRLSAETLSRLQTALAGVDDDNSIEQQLLAQRARLLGVFWNQPRAWYASPPRAFDLPGGAALIVVRPWLAHRAVSQAHLLDELLGTATRPWPDRLRSEAPRDPTAKVGSVSYVLAIPGRDATLAMHVERTRLAANTLAIVRSAIVATAIARHRLSHDDVLPAALGDLVPAFLPAVPIDPYSGQPLRYLVRGDGYAVYSIGRNEKDDGGKELNQQLSKRWGPYTRARETADIGLQVELKRTTPQ